MPRPRDPKALRRTGAHVHLVIPVDEATAAKADAAGAGRSLVEHVRVLLRTWREARARGAVVRKG